MNKARLLKLAALLDVVPPEKFNMDSWATAETPQAKEPRCATAACALGWATAIPEFAAKGLELVGEVGRWGAFVRYRGLLDGRAAEKFFDLTEEQVEALFLSDMHATPKYKAAQIRRMVEAR